MRVKLLFAVSFALVLSFAVNSTLGDMVAYYPMDEGSGTLVKDYSGYGHDGETQADPNWVDSAANLERQSILTAPIPHLTGSIAAHGIHQRKRVNYP